MPNPFDDLIPGNSQANSQNLFDDLLPARAKNIEKFKDAAGIGKPTLANDLGGGLLHGLQGMASLFPDMNRMAPSEVAKALPYAAGERPIDKIDAYKLAGTEDKPFYTPGGFAQLLGELTVPVKGGLAAHAEFPEIMQGAKNTVSKVKDYFSPGDHAKKLLQDLGQGAKNSEEIAESLGNDIRNAHDMRQQEAGVFLNHVLERAGEEPIYTKPDPLISTAMDKAKAMTDRMDNLNIGPLYDAFKAKPTLSNAHRLQSELGVMIGDIEKNPHLTIDEGRQLKYIKSVRDSLKKDMQEFLEKRDLNSNETLAPMYQKGSDLYREHVVPFLSSEKLRDIVRGGKTVVKNIHDIFANPTNIVDKVTGETRLGPINKMMQDLPKETAGKILFSKIGGNRNSGNIQKLYDSFNNAVSNGYSKYQSDRLSKNLEDLYKKYANQKYLKSVGKHLLGGIAGGATVAGLGFPAYELYKSKQE